VSAKHLDPLLTRRIWIIPRQICYAPPDRVRFASMLQSMG